MRVLGIEGTAHTLGVGIVERGPDGKCVVLANERRMVRPDQGGIHPREAAQQHAEAGPAVLHAALRAAGMEATDLDAVAFSQGPGLGPCLRVAATMARALAIRHTKPLVGVNHCVAHLEIGRGVGDMRDPLLVYASGANTQVIAFARGRYRVFGETIDVGLGNALDKFARDQGIPFPGGPEVEKLAARADPGAPLLPLPYTVKGMDISFAGVATAASRLVAQGHTLEDVCRSFQEHAFAALVETAERALAHTGKTELLLGGGVACNARLQEMAQAMAQARGAAFAAPPRSLLVDNGAMIAWLGLLKADAGGAVAPEDSHVRPYERTDLVDATWRADGGIATGHAHGSGTHRPGAAAGTSAGGHVQAGAEAILAHGSHLGRPVLRKARIAKAYRHGALDARLRAERTRDEARLMASARRAGVPVPVVLDIDGGASTLALEPIMGTTLKARLEADGSAVARARLARLGELTARLHEAGICHGDLTTSNAIVPEPAMALAAGAPGPATPPDLVLIDFGLGAFTTDDEPRGVDLHLIEEALTATRDDAHELMAAFLEAYANGRDAKGTLQRLHDIRERGRYR